MHPLNIQVKKAEDELHLVFGELYIPDVPDSDNEFMTRETIREAAHNFLRNHRTDKVDREHDNILTGAWVVESFIARDDDPLFIAGSWVIGVHIPDDNIWEAVKHGDLNGFSLQAWVNKEVIEVELEIPDVITGRTSEVDEHHHIFSVRYSPTGLFLGGSTDTQDNHSHLIIRGTQTELYGDHAHTFAVMDGF